MTPFVTMLVLATAPLQTPSAAGTNDGATRIGMSAEAVQALHKVGQCVADNDRRTAAGVLRQDFRTSAYQRGLRSLMDNNRRCIPRGQRATFSGVLGAGSIAEALLERKDGTMLATLADRAATAPATGFSPSDTAAICVVKRDPAGVRALLSSAPAGAEEEVAVVALGSTLSQCLPAGQDFRFNRPGLRAIIALSSYRIVAGAAPANRG